MTTAMVQYVMLMVLMHVFLLSHGVLSSEYNDGAPLHSGVMDLPWHDELCCDSPSAHHTVGVDATHTSQTNNSGACLPPDGCCSFRNMTIESHPRLLSGGLCLDIWCRLDEKWENLTCSLETHSPLSSTGHMAISLQGLPFQKENTDVGNENTATDHSVICEAEDSFMCSVALETATRLHVMLTVNIANATAPPLLLRVPARPVKPAPPVNLSHVQTIEAELILRWDVPSDFETGRLQCEVRYSSNLTHQAWQVLSVSGEPRTPLELRPILNYTVQVRCAILDHPPLWSDWSESYHIFLDTVSYIPEKAVVRPGENVTVYCVFNTHNINASAAMWILNFEHRLDHSQFHPVSQWVSQVTLRPSETRMYDLLQCTQDWFIPYSQIYVEGASIDINCQTSGDIDAMECKWTNTQWTKSQFSSRWADLPCDVMEEKERAGEEVGQLGPSCLPDDNSEEKTCSIQPLRMNCYKVWLEVLSPLGPVRSKPIYLTPIDHVKPHTPSMVKAVSRSSTVLMVTWEPPPLPVEGLQCQMRHYAPYALRTQLEWKVQRPVRVSWAEVTVSDMCRVYVVQVRCMHINGNGYWSEWSESVYSTPQNSRAPERGPNFWRILQDDPNRNQTSVILLFEHLQMSGSSYCVDGFIVQHRTSAGSVTREQIELVSSYRFEWNRMPHTVTVEAYNNLGNSTRNFNMTLDRAPKRRCVRSFSVLVMNSTCVYVSWTLLDNSSVPLFMVVQWSPTRKQDSELHSGDTWARLPYTDHPTYLRGDFFGSEDCGFSLYPVFADGEGEPVHTTATRGDPAVYMMLLIISFLSIVLFVTLFLSQNQMKKLMWKDVPNPSKCTWAKELDFKKVDTFDLSFRPPEGLSVCPLLLPSENVSKVVILDKIDQPALTAPPDPYGCLDSEVDPAQPEGGEVLPGGTPPLQFNLDALTSSCPGTGQSLLVDLPAGSTDSSAQSSVTYTTVLLCDPKQQQAVHLHHKDRSSNSSSDEGNFSANNSDISGSFPGLLWELYDPRRSCSYNSVEELSETSEQDNEEVHEEKELYYLALGYQAEDSEGEGEPKPELLKNVILNIEDCSLESRPHPCPTDSGELPSVLTCGFSPLYMPQFRTAPCAARQLTAEPRDGEPQL